MSTYTGKHTVIKYGSYKNFNKETFLEDLNTTPWLICDIFDNPNDALDCWRYLFMEVVDRHAPLMER